MKISATIQGVVVAICLVLVTTLVARILWWIPELLWEVFVEDFSSTKIKEFLKGLEGKKIYLAITKILFVIKYGIGALLVWSLLDIKSFTLKTFQHAQVEWLSRRIFTATGGTGLEIRTKGFGSRQGVDLLVFDPEKMIMEPREIELKVAARDSIGNPLDVFLISRGKFLNADKVYALGGVQRILTQVNGLATGSLNRFLIKHKAYTLIEEDSGRKIVQMEQKIFEEGNIAIEDVINGSEHFQTVTRDSVSYYQYLVEGVPVYEFQQFTVADVKLSASLLEAIELLQTEGLDAEGEAGKGKILQGIMSEILDKHPGTDPNGALAYAAAQLGVKIDYVNTTARVDARGSGSSIIVDGK